MLLDVPAAVLNELLDFSDVVEELIEVGDLSMVGGCFPMSQTNGLGSMPSRWF